MGEFLYFYKIKVYTTEHVILFMYLLHSELNCSYITVKWSRRMFVFIHTSHLIASYVSVSHSKVQVNKIINSLIWVYIFVFLEVPLDTNVSSPAFVFLNLNSESF